MKRRLLGILVAISLVAGMSLLGGCATTGAGSSIPADDLAGAKDLLQRYLDAFSRKDLEAASACIWNSPDLAWVAFGTVIRGYDAVHDRWAQMFAQNETVKVVVNEISYVPVGGAIIAVGTATIDMQPKSGPSVHIVERWTDVERKIDGRWVYVSNHTTKVDK